MDGCAGRRERDRETRGRHGHAFDKGRFVE
jgi:hypothetical protein